MTTKPDVIKAAIDYQNTNDDKTNVYEREIWNAAIEAAGMPYITFYMRLRAGDKPAAAIKKPVRKYEKQEG